jgi:DNA-binding transcriptional LysR family regulator
VAVTVTQLVSFLAVARCGSASAAAKELVVTQPSVSAAVNSLERELGVSLVERDGRSLRLTRAGEAYVGYATEILALLKQGARAARESSAGARRTLRIGAVMTAGEYLVAPLLRTFREAHPELEIVLHVGNRSDVFGDLAARETDVAITGRAPATMQLHSRRFARNLLAVVTAPDDPLAKRSAVALPELAARTWLLREPGSGTRILSEEYLAGHELSPETVTLGSNGAIKQAVGLGLGVALQSRCSVALEVELGMLATIRLRERLPERWWYVVRSAVGPVPAEVAAFMEFVQTPAAQYALAKVLTRE